MNERRLLAVTELRTAELACRIGEALYAVTRPAGVTPEEALDNLRPHIRDGLFDAAAAAAAYVQECMSSQDTTVMGEVQ